jgi:hypothetical protein
MVTLVICSVPWQPFYAGFRGQFQLVRRMTFTWLLGGEEVFSMY